MRSKTGHMSDEQILLLRDGGTSPLRTWWLRRHMDRCPRCQARADVLALAVTEFAEAHRVERHGAASEADGRALLKSRLLAASEARRGHLFASPSRIRGVAAPRAIAAVLLVGLMIGVSLQKTREAEREQARSRREMLRAPDLRLTPGRTRAVALDEICSGKEEVDQDPEVAVSLRDTVFREYGVDETAGQRFQVDYLISPQLGGTETVENLWPQPYGTTVWNARAKDRLEQRLHEMVCRRQIDLGTAQQAIATDWISTYQRVFETSDPL